MAIAGGGTATVISAGGSAIAVLGSVKPAKRALSGPNDYDYCLREVTI